MSFAPTIRTNASINEQCFLISLFAGLTERGISWAVMRNYESLPISTMGSDLDLLLAISDLERTESVLSDLSAQSSVVSLGSSHTLGFVKHFFLGRGEDGHWWGVRIDLNFGLAYRGAKLLQDDFSPAIETLNGVPVLGRGVAAMLGVLKEVLNNQTVPERYLSDACRAAEKDWQRIAGLLAPVGDPALTQFYDLLFKEKPGPCNSLARRFRGTIFWTAFRRRPLYYSLARLRFEFSKISRYLQPAGTIIAILGVDGVGKSTVIDATLQVLEKATHGACQVHHLRPGLLPPLARLRGKPKQVIPIQDPHGSKPSGRLGSLVRIGWALADYVLGYWLKVRPFIAKQPGIVLFDRYAYDIGLDPRRFRIGLSPRVGSWFACLAPKPDLVICLHADPSVILTRKQELPEEEVSRQVQALRDFAVKHSRAVLVSAEGAPREVADRVMEAIASYFRNRK